MLTSSYMTTYDEAQHWRSSYDFRAALHLHIKYVEAEVNGSDSGAERRYLWLVGSAAHCRGVGRCQKAEHELASVARRPRVLK